MFWKQNVDRREDEGRTYSACDVNNDFCTKFRTQLNSGFGCLQNHNHLRMILSRLLIHSFCHTLTNNASSAAGLCRVVECAIACERESVRAWKCACVGARIELCVCVQVRVSEVWVGVFVQDLPTVKAFEESVLWGCVCQREIECVCVRVCISHMCQKRAWSSFNNDCKLLNITATRDVWRAQNSIQTDYVPLS